MSDHIKSDISAYLAGGLAESRSHQIESHAAVCDKCGQALAKARAKQARLKREALKKASPNQLPNLFLTRQQRLHGIDPSPIRWPWVIGTLLLVAGIGYWFFSRPFRPPPIPAKPVARSSPVLVSTPTVSSQATAGALAQPLTRNPQPVTLSSKPETSPRVLEILREWKGADSGIKGGRLVVIRHRDNWAVLWHEMKMPEPLPPIDFEKHIVVGIFGGARGAGAAIAIGKAREDEDLYWMPYRVSGPEVSAAAGVTPSHPYLLAMFARVEKKIRLTQRETMP
jgi:hypothetical protein